jgi:hypothetical protein
MARLFNGTSDHAEVTLDLSGQTAITVSMWLWWDSLATANLAAFEYGNPNWTIGGALFTPNSTGGGPPKMGFGDATGANTWQDAFPGATFTVNKWWHVLLVYDRANKVNKAWLSGTAQTLSAGVHSNVAYGNFANSTLNVMSRNGGASLLGKGRIAELAIWGGDVSGAVVSGGHALANNLSAGVPAPLACSTPPLLYIPWTGHDSPEPDFSGGKHSATLTGTSNTNHPRTRSLLMLGDTPPEPVAVFDPVVPAAINATSPVSGSVQALKRLTPAAITATSAMSAAVTGAKSLTPAAINATSFVTAYVAGQKPVVPAAITATSFIVPIFGPFADVTGVGPGNGGESFPVALAPNGTTVVATVAAAITPTSTLLELTGDGGLPASDPFCLLIDTEVLYVVRISAGSYRIRGRGFSNTSPASHLAGTNATWGDSYEMAITAAATIAQQFTADITSSGSFTYIGGLICFDSSQAYLGGSRYPMHVTELVGVFDAGAGTTGTNRIYGPVPNAICTPAGVSDDCPAALSDPGRLAADISPGDVAVLRYTNPEASILELGPRSTSLRSMFGLKWLDAMGNDVTLSAPGTGNTVDGAVNGTWLDPVGTGINPDSGNPVPNVHYTSVTLLGSDRNFTRTAEKGEPICALAVRQATHRVPLWRSWDWHDYNYVYSGFGDDATFCQLLVEENDIFFGSVPEVALPGTQDIDGPDAVWDDGGDGVDYYYFAASWYVLIFGPPYIVAGPSIGGTDTAPPGSSGAGVIPVVDFTGGAGSPGITVPPFVEGGSGGDIPAPTARKQRFYATLV